MKKVITTTNKMSRKNDIQVIRLLSKANDFKQSFDDFSAELIVRIFCVSRQERSNVIIYLFFPHQKTGKKLSNIGLGEGGKLGLLAEIFTLGE